MTIFFIKRSRLAPFETRTQKFGFRMVKTKWPTQPRPFYTNFFYDPFLLIKRSRLALGHDVWVSNGPAFKCLGPVKNDHSKPGTVRLSDGNCTQYEFQFSNGRLPSYFQSVNSMVSSLDSCMFILFFYIKWSSLTIQISDRKQNGTNHSKSRPFDYRTLFLDLNMYWTGPIFGWQMYKQICHLKQVFYSPFRVSTHCALFWPQFSVFMFYQLFTFQGLIFSCFYSNSTTYKNMKTRKH